LRPDPPGTAGRSSAALPAIDAEESDANRTLADLEKLDVDTPEFARALAAFERAVLTHAVHEEKREFPLIRPWRGTLSTMTVSCHRGRMPEDALVTLLGRALSALVRYVDERPAEATYDDDIAALERVAAILSHTPPDDGPRLITALGPAVAADLGIQAA
jgi:hypothetical protein